MLRRTSNLFFCAYLRKPSVLARSRNCSLSYYRGVVANRAYLTERALDTGGAVANRTYRTERADFFAPSMLGSAHNFARKSAMHS